MNEEIDLTEWTQAYYKNFKPIPYTEIRQNPENQDEWQVRRSLNYSFIRRNAIITATAGKLVTIGETHTAKDKNGANTAWYQHITLATTPNKNGKKYWLHTIIRHTYPSLILNGYNAKDFPIVDHLDRNGLNNKLENLKGSDQSMNIQNRAPQGISKYKGVAFNNRVRTNRWVGKAKFKSGYKTKSFETEIEAAIYYDLEIVKMFQLHNAGTPLLNFPEKLEEYLNTIKNKGQLELGF